MKGCLTCRLRHLKCDKSGTNCLRCQRSGRECVPVQEKSERVTFRHGQNPSLRGKQPPGYGESDMSFPDNQVWVESSLDYSFKDETDQTASGYHVVSVASQESVFRSLSEARLTPLSFSPVLGPSAAVPLYVVESEPGTPSNSAMSPRSSSATQAVQPQLGNLNEAYLLRYFQKQLAPWLDAGDPEGHFYSAASRASQSPLLLYACLAASLCHLSRKGIEIAPGAADIYHERCVSTMLLLLDKPQFDIGIDILLSSTVILRFFEQISSHIPSNDPQRHLLAGSVYISSHVDCATSSGLPSASFWAFVIQDIQFSLTHQKCLRLTFAPFDDRLRRWWAVKSILTVGDWVHRATWLLAETIDFCYNASGRNYGDYLGIAGEIALDERILNWEIGRPEAFTALHISPPDPGKGKPFPVVLHTNLWHCNDFLLRRVWGSYYANTFDLLTAIAAQHVYLAKALLLIRKIEKYDSSKLLVEDRATTREQISKSLNYIFGIALSADDEPSLQIMACHALSACSSWIGDPLAQTLLFDLLRRTDRDNGWHWGYVEKRVLHTWKKVLNE